MSSEFESDIFALLWSARIKQIHQAKKTLEIPDIVNEIWTPVFKECSTLIVELKSESIKLKDIDRCFRPVEEKRMVTDLGNLCKAIEVSNRGDQPLGTPVQSPDWIVHVVKHIQQYWSLREQAEAANTLLKLKDRLKLTGDFGIIQKVASQGTKSVKDAPLSSITDEVLEAKEFLEEISNDKKKLVCLNSFADSMSLVEWIGQETTG